jgi:hypothetical protein
MPRNVVRVIVVPLEDDFIHCHSVSNCIYKIKPAQPGSPPPLVV